MKCTSTHNRWVHSQTCRVGLEAGAAVVATTARAPHPACTQELQKRAVVVGGQGRLETGLAQKDVAERTKAGSSVAQVDDRPACGFTVHPR